MKKILPWIISLLVILLLFSGTAYFAAKTYKTLTHTTEVVTIIDTGYTGPQIVDIPTPTKIKGKSKRIAILPPISVQDPAQNSVQQLHVDGSDIALLDLAVSVQDPAQKSVQKLQVDISDIALLDLAVSVQDDTLTIDVPLHRYTDTLDVAVARNDTINDTLTMSYDIEVAGELTGFSYSISYPRVQTITQHTRRRLLDVYMRTGYQYRHGIKDEVRAGLSIMTRNYGISYDIGTSPWSDDTTPTHTITFSRLITGL